MSQNHPGAASTGVVERAKVASSVFRRVASRKVAPKRRKPAETSRTQPGTEKDQVKMSIQVASNVLDLLYLSIIALLKKSRGKRCSEYAGACVEHVSSML